MSVPCYRGEGDCRSPSALWNISRLGKRRLLPPNTIHATTAASTAERTWRAWKRSTTPQEIVTDHAKHSRFNPFDFQSPPGSAAVATSHGDAAIRKPPSPFPRPCADDDSLEDCKISQGSQASSWRCPSERYLQLLSCALPLGPKPGETSASCRHVEMAFGRRSLGCVGLQQTRASSQYAGTGETLFKVSFSTPRLSIVDRHGQAS